MVKCKFSGQGGQGLQGVQGVCVELKGRIRPKAPGGVGGEQKEKTEKK